MQTLNPCTHLRMTVCWSKFSDHVTKNFDMRNCIMSGCRDRQRCVLKNDHALGTALSCIVPIAAPLVSSELTFVWHVCTRVQAQRSSIECRSMSHYIASFPMIVRQPARGCSPLTSHHRTVLNYQVLILFVPPIFVLWIRKLMNDEGFVEAEELAKFNRLKSWKQTTEKIIEVRRRVLCKQEFAHSLVSLYDASFIFGFVEIPRTALVSMLSTSSHAHTTRRMLNRKDKFCIKRKFWTRIIAGYVSVFKLTVDSRGTMQLEPTRVAPPNPMHSSFREHTCCISVHVHCVAFSISLRGIMTSSAASYTRSSFACCGVCAGIVFLLSTFLALEEQSAPYTRENWKIPLPAHTHARAHTLHTNTFEKISLHFTFQANSVQYISLFYFPPLVVCCRQCAASSEILEVSNGAIRSASSWQRFVGSSLVQQVPYRPPTVCDTHARWWVSGLLFAS